MAGKLIVGFSDLATKNPDIAAEWHPTKNGKLTPKQVTSRSGKKYWWLGMACQHEWEAAINNRTVRGSGCPYCARKRVLVGFNDLATTHPVLAAEWHPTKNGELTPKQVLAGSHQMIWWLGMACQHEWETQLNDRSGQAQGCPVCLGRRVLVGFNDLATTDPVLAAEWHPTKNGELTPKQLTAGSHQMIWWLGMACQHEWKAWPNDRSGGGNGCPVCANLQILVGFNDLATTHPVLAAEWHPTKNGELTPKHVIAGSKKKYWWRGTCCAHEWNASLGERSGRGYGCPYCARKRVLVGFNDLATTHPVLAAEWHPTKNGEVSPSHVTSGSAKKVWWRGTCGHEWNAALSGRKAGSGCPVCVNLQILVGFNDLATTHPVLAAEWHPTKNGELTPKLVGGGSAKKVWWRGTCGHEWNGLLVGRINGSGCPVCENLQIFGGFNDLATTHPVLAAEWHPTKNGELTPELVGGGSAKKVWWRGTCGHEWQSQLASRTNGSGCPVCVNLQILIGFNDLATTHPVLAAEWHPTKNGEVTPSHVSSGSGKKVWWRGICNHEWQSQLSSRAKGTGCPKCVYRVSKAEEQLQGFLTGLGLIVEGSNRTILDGKEIDLWIPDKKVGIEFNGIYWHTEARGKGKTYHYEKWLAAKKVGVQLIQIWEDDWNLHPEIIMRSLAHKLGVSKTGSIATNIKVITITEQQAEKFLSINHLQGFASGAYYLGLVEEGGTKNLQAVMVLDAESNSEGNALEIIRYASTTNISDDFSKLLSNAISAYSPSSISVIADHCEATDELYANNDFIVDKELPPDYMYVMRTGRKPRSEYSLERFRDDPTLLWEEGLTEMELADLNGLDRIWDAGKTLYQLSL